MNFKKITSLFFILASFVTSIAQIPEVSDAEREALIALYNATDGDNWLNTRFNQQNWSINDPDSNVNNWFGVTVINDKVTRLDLKNNNLVGYLPEELAQLTSLTHLKLTVTNSALNPIPDWIGNLTSLTELELTGSDFTPGPIPDWIGNLTSLRVLNIGRMGFTGSIPSELGNLSSVESLYLSENQLTGSIPQELGNLTSLTSLQLRGNTSLTGSIPPELGNLTSLITLFLEDCDLTGSIPPELGNLTSLTHLHLENNNLTGSIPSELGSLTSLVWLRLFNNNLTGSIPSELGNLSSVESLYLSGNQLTGSIPSELGNLSSVEDLFLHENQLTGSIPLELGNLSSVESLYLSENQLTGSIPSELGNLSSVENLHLHENQLTGEIPLELSNLNAAILIDSNNFVFSEIEDSFEVIMNSVPFPNYYRYSPQANVDQTETLSVAQNESITLTSEALTSPNNTCRWFKDGVAIGTPTTTKELVIENATEADAGQYYFIAINSMVEGLTLTRNPITLEVIEAVDTCGVSEEERDALVALYNSTDGENWTNTWDLSLSPCEWYGITVEDNTVTSINLSSNGLSGELPSDIGSLINLESFTLFFNSLEGEIPSEIGNLTNLVTIHFLGNDLSGEIPVDLANLTDLAYLSLGDNQLSGNIPSELKSLTKLTRLFLNDNQLTGSIPTEIGAMTALLFVDLNRNNLTGNIPTELGELSNLIELKLSFNELSGVLPIELGNLSNLTSFWIEDNNIEGTIPSEYSNLQNLQNIHFHGNNFSGKIPAEIGVFSALEYFYLNTNNFVFDDFDTSFLSIPTFGYASQTNLEASPDQSISIGDSFTIQAHERLQHPDNVYRWYKSIDNGLTFVLVDGFTSEDFIIDNATLSDVSQYKLEITNTTYSSLKITQNPTLITVEESTCEIVPSEKEALLDLYAKANGDTWVNTIAGEGIWSEDTLVCEWYGITTSEDGEHVEKIELPNNGLTGVLSMGKNDFSELLVLNLSNNAITGTIPSELSGMLKLQEMDLGFNQLEGEIPEEYGSLLNLEKLDLSNNQLTGNVPITFCTLGDAIANGGLTYLSLANNNLEGAITSSIGPLSFLEQLDLSGNSFSGFFPSFVRAITIDISSNQFSGSIPSFYGQLSSLTAFAFDTNNYFFTDFEDEHNAYLENLGEENYVYAPQNKVDEETEQTVLEGTTYEITTALSSSNNQYVWYKDGEVYENEGTNEKILSFESITPEHAGVYSFKATNSIVEGLEIERNTVTVSVTESCDVSETIKSALLGFYTATNGDNWTNTIAGENVWSTDNPVCNWHGVLVEDANVVEIDLSNNGLDVVSVIPFGLTSITTLEKFDISANDFIFSDIESIYEGLFNLLGDQFIYDPQNEVGTERFLDIPLGEALTLSDYGLFNSPNNSYTWLYNGNPIATDQPNSEYSIESVSAENEGAYILQVSNSNIPNLVLSKKQINVTTNADAVSTDCTVSEQEKQALWTLYESTDGANWTNTLAEDHPWSLDTPVCDWYGVTVDSDSNVTRLDLENNNLSGEIPSKIADLSSLTRLHLHSNALEGEIPVEISNLTELDLLHIAANEFIGEIPEQLGNLTKLEYLNLGNNNLEGGIPENLSNLINLEALFLFDNKLSGELPEFIGDLSLLNQLVINDNSFSGNLPASLGNAVNLTWVRINNNLFVGELPFNSSTITSTTSSSNLLTDGNHFVFADFLSIYTELKDALGANFDISPQAKVDTEETKNSTTGSEVILSSEALTSENNSYQWYKDNVAIEGAITKDYIIESATEDDAGVYHFTATNSTITDLILERNPITLSVFEEGTCGEVSDVERQALIDFYNNTDGPNWTNTVNEDSAWDVTNLESDICTWYGITVNANGDVSGLHLGANNLRGEIPASITDLSNLEVFNAQQNNLSGLIPENIGSFFYLKELNLSENNLVGEIPVSIVNLPSIEKVNISDNFFKGTLPSEIGNLITLEEFDASRNILSGGLPNSFYNLNNLRVFKITDNNLTGDIDTNFTALSSLEIFWVSNNRFSSLSFQDSNVSNQPNLNSVHLDNNNFGSTLPTFNSLISNNGSLKFENNRFIFSDFEADDPDYEEQLSEYTYIPQDFVDSTGFIALNIGDAVTLTSAELVSGSNLYTWFKLDTSTDNWVALTEASPNKDYELTISTEVDFGQYRFESTNTVIDGLILTRRTITVSEAGIDTITDSDGDGVDDQTEIDNGSDPKDPDSIPGNTDDNGAVITETPQSECPAFPFFTLDQVNPEDVGLSEGISIKWFEFDYTSEEYDANNDLILDVNENTVIPYPDTKTDSFEVEDIIAYNSGEKLLDFNDEGIRNLFELNPIDVLVYPEMVLYAQIDGIIDSITEVTLPAFDTDLSTLPSLPHDGFDEDPDYTQYFTSLKEDGTAHTVSDLVSNTENTNWYTTLDGFEEYDPNAELDEDNIYYAAIGEDLCRIRVFVEIGAQDVNVDGSQSFCAVDLPKVSDLVVDHQENTSLIYYKSEDGNDQYNLDDLLVDGLTYYIVEDDGLTLSENRIAITVDIFTADVPIIPETNITIYRDADGNATIANLYPFVIGDNVKFYLEEDSTDGLLETEDLIDTTYYVTQKYTTGCESIDRVALAVTIEDEPDPEYSLCEKFRPNPGAEYVISGWVRQQGIRPLTTEPRAVNVDIRDVLPALGNYILTEHVFVENDGSLPIALQRFIPEVYIPKPAGDETRFDPLKDYLIESESDNITLYGFEYIIQEQTINKYKRYVGFKFSFTSDGDDDFIFMTPKYEEDYTYTDSDTGVQTAIEGSRYPLLNNNDNISIEFIGYDETALANNELKLTYNFEAIGAPSWVENSESHVAVMEDPIENILINKDFVTYESDPNYSAINYTESKIEVNYYSDAEGTFLENNGQQEFMTSGSVIEGWQRISAKFRVPADAYEMEIKLKNESDINVYFDDIRFHPYDSNMKTFVYDPVTQRLQAELDENNFATFYEYDKEGGLIRVKKETERGVYTIQETRSGNSKYNITADSEDEEE